MRLIVADDARAAAQSAAAWIAARLREDIAARGRAVVAFSGGASARPMLEALGVLPLPWRQLVVFQVDERVAPPGSDERNLTALSAALPSLPPSRLHAMPVECDEDLDSAAQAYDMLLHAMAGTPPVLDLVHLGLGDDGHTASLFPGDPALEIVATDVVVVGMQRGHRRMSLSLPTLSRARRRVWLVTGAGKASQLAALLRGESATLPASRVERSESVVFGDALAAALAAREGPDFAGKA